MSRAIRTFSIIAVLAALPAVGRAGLIPYDNIGTEAPANSFIATGTGAVYAYFYNTEAAYDSQIGLLVNGVSTGIFGLPNHASSQGQSLFLGNVVKDDVLVFQLKVITTGESYFSNPSQNLDGGLNHVYATLYTADAGIPSIPSGTYIGFEDLPGLGDRDYNDHQFVVVYPNLPDVTNNAVATPEPGSLVVWSLMACGATIVASRRRRAANA